MRTRRLSAVALVLSTLLFAIQARAEAPPDSVVAKHGRLRVKGNRIVDKNGDPVALHGMSLFWSQWIGKYYNPGALKWLHQDWGCTLVRAALAVEHGGYLRNPEREKKKVETVVQAAIDLGIYVIIDWHDHNAHQHAKEARTFFSEMAGRYGKHPNVIFETWNEPLNTHDWKKTIKPYHEALIPVIRAHAPEALVVCGTQTWSQDVDKAAADPLQFENVAYTLHFYAATHKQSLRRKAEAALKQGLALFVTEWGTCECTGNGELSYTETARWLEFMDRHQLSWCNWSVADKKETAAALKPGASEKGSWTDANLTPSGKLLRKALRARRK